jgi:hypothetical protein
MQFQKIDYKDLDARQKEAYNLQKLSGVLADYGMIIIKLSSDWQGADLIAQHCKTLEFLPIQLKSRFSLFKKYCGKGLWVAFRDGSDWYLYDHDALLMQMEAEEHKLLVTASWKTGGGYTVKSPSKALRVLLEPYRLHPSG